MEFTREAEVRLYEYLFRDGYIMPSGIGTKENACSIAAINLAISGELTSRIPLCMSLVMGRWIIVTQDKMPFEMRNSTEWKTLLPLAAGTGRELEQERLDMIMDWMWGKVLPWLHPIADDNGFGSQWRDMCEQRTSAAAYAAYAAAIEVLSDLGISDEHAHPANRASNATYAAYNASRPTFTGTAATNAAFAANRAAFAAVHAAGHKSHDAYAEAWKHFNPVALLDKLIRVGSER